jgi:hypothetical protein
MLNACCGITFAIVDFAASSSDGNTRSAPISRISHRPNAGWSWKSMVGSIANERRATQSEPPV